MEKVLGWSEDLPLLEEPLPTASALSKFAQPKHFRASGFTARFVFCLPVVCYSQPENQLGLKILNRPHQPNYNQDQVLVKRGQNPSFESVSTLR
ncbi:hypothetical protein [Thermoleptolyngbya sp.]